MTALSLQPVRAPSLPDRRCWVDLDEAAGVLGKSEGHLRRVCAELQPKGQARRHLVNGRRVWQIAASYDPRLVRAPIERTERGTSIVHELLKGSTEEQRAAANTRFAILKAFRAAKGGAGFDLKKFRARMIAEHGSCPGRAQLYQWHADCPPSNDPAGCVAALLDRRGRPKGSVEACSDAAWQAFCGLYLDMRQPSVAKCYKAVRTEAKAQGWAWPSYRYVCQLVDQRIDPSVACLHREGKAEWQRKFQAPMQQDPEAWAAGQCWEGDHSVLDFEVRVVRGDGWARTRPQLTAWLDRRTRRLMGWAISEQGNARTIRQALLDGLRDPAVSAPEIVWIDNGKDFMARSVGGVTKQARRTMTADEKREAERAATGLLNMLGIEPHFATPYNHNGKARVERFFGTVHADFDKDFRSYIGNKPGAIDRLAMDADLRDTMNLPTLAEVRGKFAEWAEWYNHRAEHAIDDLRDPETRQRLSPAEFYDRFLPTRRAIDADALTMLEPILSTPLKVGKRGVGFKVAGTTVYFGELEPALEPLVGTDRRVYIGHDPEDMSSVRVWDEQFRFLCVAPLNDHYGGRTVKYQDLQAGFGQRKAQRRRVKERVDLTALVASSAELAARAAREREIGETKARIREHDRTRDPSDVPNVRLVRTPLDGQADQVRRAEQRKAVGCEFDAPLNMPSLIDAVASFHQPQSQAPTDAFAGMASFEAVPQPSQTRGPAFDAAPPSPPPPSSAPACDADPYDFAPPPPPDAHRELRITDAFL